MLRLALLYARQGAKIAAAARTLSTLDSLVREIEEAGGEAWTDEKKAEYEKRVTGKILASSPVPLLVLPAMDS